MNVRGAPGVRSSGHRQLLATGVSLQAMGALGPGLDSGSVSFLVWPPTVHIQGNNKTFTKQSVGKRAGLRFLPD